MTSASPPPARRIGAPDSKTRAHLVDAAEQLLLEEGYAAVTSRRVGATAGLKAQLVHYYFRSMDDLFIEVFRRRAEENLARVEQALAGTVSLRTLWELNADPRGTAFSIEFVAMAKHRTAIRAEVARYAERYRSAQLRAMNSALAVSEVPADTLPPVVALLLMTGLSQVLSLERSLGVVAGHDETIEFVIDLIDRLDARR
ncbi:MAG TPA: TetR/AcrR family transcriptional regulator [Acidimicrobiales bacterium]|nr:TetR/AcrR family transcriptional regulator [Acidimicrobiales bacterium]